MINELWWIIMLIINFVCIMAAFRIWGKLGLFIWVPISVIVANIQVTKTVNLFGLEATLGNIVYATGFLATDLLSEFFGPKESRKAVFIGFFSLIAMTILMQLSLLFTPAESDFVQGSLATIFGIMPRIAIGSLIAYLISNFHDISAYEFWKKRKPGDKYLWLRNNASTMISQLLDSIVFTFIAFWGLFPLNVWLQILLTTYILKWFVALCDTPFMYLAKKWVKDNKVDIN